MTKEDFIKQAAIQIMAALAVNEDAEQFAAKRHEVAGYAVASAEALAKSLEEDHIFDK